MKKNNFNTYDFVIMALLASLGIAIKPVIYPVIHIFTSPIKVPGGTAAGGFYMMWMLIGQGIVGKKGTCTLISIVQAFLALILGISSSYGMFTLILYASPGIALDILFAFHKKDRGLYMYFIGGIVSNLVGTFMSSYFYFRLPFIPMMLCLSVASLSGGLGGIAAYIIVKYLKSINVIENGRDNHYEK